jgi:hypothetical protein
LLAAQLGVNGVDRGGDAAGAPGSAQCGGETGFADLAGSSGTGHQEQGRASFFAGQVVEGGQEDWVVLAKHRSELAGGLHAGPDCILVSPGEYLDRLDQLGVDR